MQLAKRTEAEASFPNDERQRLESDAGVEEKEPPTSGCAKP